MIDDNNLTYQDIASYHNFVNDKNFSNYSDLGEKEVLTVSEIFSKAEELNGQTVMVRGRIMKVSPQSMGRNLVHIQDGSEKTDDKTPNLVVTTTQNPKADWGIITAEGVLTANKDFGTGIAYEVIVEDANLKDQRGSEQ